MDLDADRAIGELRRQLVLARDDLDLANRRADDERRRADLLAGEVRDLTWDLAQARAAAGGGALMALVLHPGSIGADLTHGVGPGPRRQLSLEQMQEIVGGYIEIVRLTLKGGAPALMVVNEDGIRLGLAPNRAASLIAGQPILGHAIVASTSEID